MKPIDLTTMVQLTFGLVWGVAIFILYKRNKSKPKLWPRIFGIGIGVFWFVVSMIGSMMLWPISEFVNYTITNSLWSLAAGIVGYFSGHKIARMRDKS